MVVLGNPRLHPLAASQKVHQSHAQLGSFLKSVQTNNRGHDALLARPIVDGVP